jgi:N-acetylmuramoyl-L-alanine amidase
MAVVVNPTWLAPALLCCALCSPPALGAPDPAEQAYQGARSGYYALKADAKARRLRDSWLTVARRFEAVAKSYPRSGRAPDALFTAAQMLGDLSRISLLPEDTTASVDDYRTLLDTYPHHRLADDAALALARAYLDRLNQPESAKKVLRRGLQLPRGDQTAKMRALLASLPAEPRERSAGGSSKHPETPAERKTLRGGSAAVASEAGERSTGKASASSSGASVARTKDSREAENGRSRSRLDSTEPAEPRGGAPTVAAEPSAGRGKETHEDSPPPDRTGSADEDDGDEIVQAGGGKRVAGVSSSPEPEVPRVKGVPDAGPLLALAPAGTVRERLRALGKRRSSDVTLAEQLGLKVRRVVIDAGHGGHDTGTIGAAGTKEKDVALAIAKRVGAILRDQGLMVVQTRERDRFVRLEDRTRMANVARGDLFLSIHCNSVPQKSLRGVETYSLNLSSDRYAIRLAARENSTSEKGLSDLQFLLADLTTRANTEESVRLATRVQNALVSRLVSRHEKSRDLGTKEALFYVLLGTKMPAILVETGFLSNAEEEHRLGSAEGQEAVARAIAAGVQDFLGNRERVAKVD